MTVPYCKLTRVGYRAATMDHVLSASGYIDAFCGQAQLLAEPRSLRFYADNTRPWYDLGLPIKVLTEIADPRGNTYLGEGRERLLTIADPPGQVTQLTASGIFGWGMLGTVGILAADMGLADTDIGIRLKAGDVAIIGDSELVYWEHAGEEVVRDKPRQHAAGAVVELVTPPSILTSIAARVAVRVARSEVRGKAGSEGTRQSGEILTEGIKLSLRQFARGEAPPLLSDSDSGGGIVQTGPVTVTLVTPDTQRSIAATAAERVLGLVDAGPGLDVAVVNGRITISLMSANAIETVYGLYLADGAPRPQEADWLAGASVVNGQALTARLRPASALLPGLLSLWFAIQTRIPVTALSGIRVVGGPPLLDMFSRRANIRVAGNRFTTYQYSAAFVGAEQFELEIPG